MAEKTTIQRARSNSWHLHVRFSGIGSVVEHEQLNLLDDIFECWSEV